MNRTGDAIEPGIERRDDLGRRIGFRQGREVAQIRIEQRGLYGLAEIAPQRCRQHPLRTALAEISIPTCRAFPPRKPRGAAAAKRRG